MALNIFKFERTFGSSSRLPLENRRNGSRDYAPTHSISIKSFTFNFQDDRGFEDSFVRLSQSPRPPTQVNSSSYDNEILDGGDQSGRPSLAITRISNISSTVDACQATQTINDQDNNVLFALHL